MEDQVITGIAGLISTGLVTWGVTIWNSWIKTQKQLAFLEIKKNQKEWLEDRAEDAIKWVYEQLVKNGKKSKNEETALDKPKNEELLNKAINYVKDSAAQENISIPSTEEIQKAIERNLPWMRVDLDEMLKIELSK